MTEVQKAIILDELSLSTISLDGYDVVYYGDEFCQNLIPAFDELVQVKEAIGKRTLVLLTPYITDVGLERIRLLLRQNEVTRVFSEIVVNDFGVLQVVKDEGSRITVNLGRNLIKFIFREKRNMSINHPFVKGLLEAYNIAAYEIGALNDQVILPEDVPLHIYTAYFPLTTTRRCLMGFPDGHIKTFEQCNHSCKGRLYEARNPVIKDRLLIRGNTYFLRHEGMPELPNRCSRVIDFPLEHQE